MSNIFITAEVLQAMKFPQFVQSKDRLILEMMVKGLRAYANNPNLLAQFK